MRSRGVFRILPSATGDGACWRRREIGAAEDPGTIRQGVDGADLASFCRQPERLWCDLEKLCGFAEVQPWFDPVVVGFEHRDAMMRSQRRNALACPAIAMAWDEAVAVQDAGDEIVIGDQRQLTHSGDDVGGGAVALS